MRIKNYILAAALAASLPASMYGQTDSTAQDFSEMSLEDLMNVTIVSASRTEEKAFDAPLSSFVISRKEIMNAGITSLPEALRLCPGLVVKQMYNGTYDVSIRGLDGLPTHDVYNYNTNTLVMINNRPVFDYAWGGSLWNNLPVDIIDVEKIEVVLGPSSPLYGPNAVNGVINIITRNTDKDGVNANAHVTAGNLSTYIGQAWVAYQANSKLNVTGSVNFQERQRPAADLYDEGVGKYITDFSQSSKPAWQDPASLAATYPSLGRAMNKLGVNASINYKPKEDVDLHLAGGFLNSNYMFGFPAMANVSSFSNDSRYGVLKGNIKGLSFLASSVNGTQFYGGTSGQYDYLNTDGYLDYNIKITDKFSIRPAVNLQWAAVNDNAYGGGTFNGKKEMYNLGTSLKADYSIGKFRFIGAIRGDKFKYPNTWYASYQAIVNYKPSDKHIFRAIFARSNGGSFMSTTYLDVHFGFPGVNINLYGNKDKKLKTNTMYELGYRTQLADNLQLDVALFSQLGSGYTAMVNQGGGFDPMTMTVTQNIVISDLDLFAVQNGGTVSLNWVGLNNKLQVRPYMTVQKTKLYHYSPFYTVPGPMVDPDHNTTTQRNLDSRLTPGVYGGFYANYAPTEKWNINLNGYLMSKYEMYTSISLNANSPDKEIDESYFKTKFILNAKVSYQATKNFNVFANVRNLLGQNTREFLFTDKIGAMYMGGVTFNY